MEKSRSKLNIDDYFDSLDWFKRHMAKKLIEHQAKGHWLTGNMTTESAISGLVDEIDEVLMALHQAEGFSEQAGGPPPKEEGVPDKMVQDIIDECADVANYAMMVADLVREKYGFDR